MLQQKMHQQAVIVPGGFSKCPTSWKHPFRSFPPFSMRHVFCSIASTISFVLCHRRVFRVLHVLGVKFYMCLWTPKFPASCIRAQHAARAISIEIPVMDLPLDATNHILHKLCILLCRSALFMPATLFHAKPKAVACERGALGELGEHGPAEPHRADCFPHQTIHMDVIVQREGVGVWCVLWRFTMHLVSLPFFHRLWGFNTWCLFTSRWHAA